MNFKTEISVNFGFLGVSNLPKTFHKNSKLAKISILKIRVETAISLPILDRFQETMAQNLTLLSRGGGEGRNPPTAMFLPLLC